MSSHQILLIIVIDTHHIRMLYKMRTLLLQFRQKTTRIINSRMCIHETYHVVPRYYLFEISPKSFHWYPVSTNLETWYGIQLGLCCDYWKITKCLCSRRGANHVHIAEDRKICDQFSWIWRRLITVTSLYLGVCGDSECPYLHWFAQIH